MDSILQKAKGAVSLKIHLVQFDLIIIAWVSYSPGFYMVAYPFQVFDVERFQNWAEENSVRTSSLEGTGLYCLDPSRYTPSADLLQNPEFDDERYMELLSQVIGAIRQVPETIQSLFVNPFHFLLHWDNAFNFFTSPAVGVACYEDDETGRLTAPPGLDDADQAIVETIFKDGRYRSTFQQFRRREITMHEIGHHVDHLLIERESEIAHRLIEEGVIQSVDQMPALRETLFKTLNINWKTLKGQAPAGFVSDSATCYTNENVAESFLHYRYHGFVWRRRIFGNGRLARFLQGTYHVLMSRPRPVPPTVSRHPVYRRTG